MSENSADNPQQQRFWVSASGFWRGLPAWRVWLLCAALVAAVVLQRAVPLQLLEPGFF
jgi:vitamin B12/bleomycin/antimicrobial peptide transport system ATP-binding/permease protein